MLSPDGLDTSILLHIRNLSMGGFYLIKDFSYPNISTFLFLIKCWLYVTSSVNSSQAPHLKSEFLFSARQDNKRGGKAVNLRNIFTCTKCTISKPLNIWIWLIKLDNHFFRRPPKANFSFSL